MLGAAAAGVFAVRGRIGSAPEAGPAAWVDPTGAPAQGDASSAPAGPTVSLSAVGDTIIAAAPLLPPDGGADLFAGLRPALASDLQMANLEEPVTDDTGVSKCGAGSANCHAFRAPPSYAKVLKDAGFGLVNLANNHAYDFGRAGHLQTRAALDAAGVKYTGPPGMITMVTVKGIRVAVLGFAPYPWANSLTDVAAAADLVRQAKAQADIVVVQAHVGAEGAGATHVKPGTEYYLGENRGDSIKFGHAVVDAGADLVVMHGPHVMRAMEFYKGRLIAYSMGNFVGYHALKTGGVLSISGILHVTLARNGRYVSGHLVATLMVAPGVPQLDPANKAWSQVRSLSTADFPRTGAGIGPDGAIVPPSG
ncbi:MAG: CapA family protein [Micromonosporaceae bacterium]|nr:CapA family protein [Micromonosporaceae bacterium]